MPIPKEQAAEGSPEADQAIAEPSADQGPADGSHAQPEASAQEQATPNRFATASLVAGILGVTGLGIVLGIAFGILGLARSKRCGSGKVRCWAGITASLLWAGAFIYVAPHVVKAADPGCTAYKERALTHYDRAIEDFGTRVSNTKTTADLNSAIADLRAAAAKSRNAESKSALSNLTVQLRKALADENSGQVPGSVMRALNHDASVADSACGTL
jgi:hypothetical protein